MIHWRIILLLSLALFSCGRTDRGSGDSLQVILEVPPTMDSRVFWSGVENRVLLLQRAGTTVPETYPGSGNIDISCNEGDWLRFEGRSSMGELLVDGQARVGKEKKLSIPLHRRL